MPMHDIETVCDGVKKGNGKCSCTRGVRVSMASSSKQVPPTARVSPPVEAKTVVSHRFPPVATWMNKGFVHSAVRDMGTASTMELFREPKKRAKDIKELRRSMMQFSLGLRMCTSTVHTSALQTQVQSISDDMGTMGDIARQGKSASRALKIGRGVTKQTRTFMAPLERLIKRTTLAAPTGTETEQDEKMMGTAPALDSVLVSEKECRERVHALCSKVYSGIKHTYLEAGKFHSLRIRVRDLFFLHEAAYRATGSRYHRDWSDELSSVSSDMGLVKDDTEDGNHSGPCRVRASWKRCILRHKKDMAW